MKALRLDVCSQYPEVVEVEQADRFEELVSMPPLVALSWAAPKPILKSKVLCALANWTQNKIRTSNGRYRQIRVTSEVSS